MDFVNKQNKHILVFTEKSHYTYIIKIYSLRGAMPLFHTVTRILV